MITSTHDSAVRRILHTTTLRRTMIRLLIYILARLAFAHSVPCNVLHLLKSRHSARSSTTMTICGRLYICLVPKRFSVFLVELRLGSDSWCASSLSNKTMQY